jgi:selenocysteine lyase/cysteine desulfurase
MPTPLLASQRALFDIPDDVCYLNAAAWSPLPRSVVDAGRIGAARKARPWELDADFANRQHERARTAAARLIHAEPDDVALISSVGYGCSTAAKNFPVPAGSRVLLLEDDHTSPMLDWMVRSESGRFQIEIVRRPGDQDWTRAVLEAIERPDAAPLAIASISSVHWSDGGAVDLQPVADALKRKGAGFLIDATHAAGIMDIDVGALDPDFVVFPTYKWLLGPYGRAFAYIAKRNQDGIPLEQTAYGRRNVVAEHDIYFADLRYRSDARRFDMGERDHFISMEMASVGMELVASWGTVALTERLRYLTGLIADGLRDCSVIALPDDRARAPHILSVAFAGGMPADLVSKLANEKIFVAPRLGRMRISPHAYNSEADIDRFVSTLRRLLR